MPETMGSLIKNMKDVLDEYEFYQDTSDRNFFTAGLMYDGPHIYMVEWCVVRRLLYIIKNYVK